MSIKAKLSTLALVVGSLLCLVSGYLVSSAVASRRRLDTADQAVQDLHRLVKARLYRIRQTGALTAYVVTGDKKARDRYSRYRNAAPSDDIETGERGEGRRRAAVKAADLDSLCESVARLKANGAHREAFDLLRLSVVPALHGFVQASDEDLARRRLAADRAYDRLLLRIGAVPWIPGQEADALSRGRRAVEYMLGADRTCTAIGGHVAAVMLASRTMEPSSGKGQQTLGLEAAAALTTWIRLVRSGGEEGKDLQNALNVEKKYIELQAQIRQEHKGLGPGGDLAKHQEALWTVVDGYILPKIAKAYDESVLAIYQAHRGVGTATETGGYIGAAILVAVSLLIVALTAGLLFRLLNGLGRLEVGAGELGKGNLGYRIDLRAGDELGRLAGAFDRMAEELQHSTVHVRELEAAKAQLLQNRDRLRDLASELVLAEENERRRIALLLHDDIGQTLALIKIRLAMLGRDGDDGKIGEKVSELLDLLDGAIRDTRTLTFDLSPPVLHELGLEAGLNWLGERLAAESDVVFSFDVVKDSTDLDKEVVLFLFQAVQEILRNVLRHAQARSVNVASSEMNGNYEVVVTDDGCGFDMGDRGDRWEPGQGYGLFSIRERARFLGGSMTMTSAPGEGTKVNVEVPKTSGLQGDRQVKEIEP